jgi:ClpP class serine protease
MPAWNDLLEELNRQAPDKRGDWLIGQQQQALQGLAAKRGHHVVLYGSAFLQKPQIPAINLSITHEDLNGLMSVIHGMTWSKGLTLVLHTPGGLTNATESIVAYLRSKFDYIEVIVPALAMSAGTMLSLAADRIVMGRQSQLGPIDPQMPIGGKSVSARAVVEQFDRAKREILADVATAHVWAPILQSLGPACSKKHKTP